MEKKYQVFVSSTYKDLKEERKAVIDSLWLSGFIPACMESFVASDEKQFDVIKRIIDLCDYFVLIIGRKYGTVCKETGISYTEMEYNYAVSMNIPVLVFPLADSVTFDPEEEKVKTEDNPDYKDKLKKFRDRATEKRMAGIWHSADELGKQVTIAMMNAKYELYRPGWQRDTGEEEHRRVQIADLQRTLDLLKENQMLYNDIKRHMDHETELEKQREELLEKQSSEEQKYKEKYKKYEGRWIQHIDGFTRPYTVCTLEYNNGQYQFHGTNYSDEENDVPFKAQVVKNSHIIKKDDLNSFCYITDAHQAGKGSTFLRGFGEVEFDSSNTHTGSGYFYDVAAAVRQKNALDDGEELTAEYKKKDTAALQDYTIIKVDEELHKQLEKEGYVGTFEEFNAKKDEELWKIIREYGDKIFPKKDKTSKKKK